MLLGTLALSVGSFLVTTIQSEVIQCNVNANAQCGPCTGTGTCNLKCHILSEVCMESIFQCQADTACVIDCNSELACESSLIYALTVPSLTMNCNGLESCASDVLSLGSGADVTINCGADSACLEMSLNAQSANNVVINCNGPEGCKAMNIICGSGDCLVNCNDSGPSPCSSIILNCGQSKNCQIDCTMDSRTQNPKCPSLIVSVGKSFDLYTPLRRALLYLVHSDSQSEVI